MMLLVLIVVLYETPRATEKDWIEIPTVFHEHYVLLCR